MAKSKFGVIGEPQIHTYIADTDLAAGVAVVAGAASNSVALPGAQNANPIGVTAMAVSAGQPVPVVEFGEVTGIADAAINRNDYVMINAVTGQLAPIGAVAGTNYHVVGKALEAAAAQGDEFCLMVFPSRAQG